MTDVARIAGVSQSSVSLVLNQMTGARISEATRSRVLEVARQIGYELPGSRRSDRSLLERNSIAYLIDEISTSAHPVLSLDGARDMGWEAGFLVAAHVTRSNPELEAATLQSIVQDTSVIGVIYSTIFTRCVSPPRVLDSIPTVLLNCHADGRSFPSVVPGELSGALIATEHLLGRGHRRIAFINGEIWMEASADRLDGYRRALALAKIPFDPSLVRNGDWLPSSGRQWALELLQLTQRPTALFCANDLMAVGALEAAAELGLRVPNDLSVVGYDDHELSRYTTPPMTTVVLPSYEMGRRAVELLIDLTVHNKTLPARPNEITGPLIERQSVGPWTQV